MLKLWILFIYVISGVLSDIDIEYANQRFKECCLKMGMLEQCADACAYNQTERDIEEAFTDGCPMSGLKQLFICASNFKNNTDCCERNNLFDNNRDVCRMFCEPQGIFDWPQTVWDVVQFLQCEAIHDKVFQCHLTNANYTKMLNTVAPVGGMELHKEIVNVPARLGQSNHDSKFPDEKQPMKISDEQQE